MRNVHRKFITHPFIEYVYNNIERTKLCIYTQYLYIVENTLVMYA